MEEGAKMVSVIAAELVFALSVAQAAIKTEWLDYLQGATRF